MALAKNQLVELEITGVTGEGNGVARYVDGEIPAPGLVVFVPRTAVGDRIRCRIVKLQKSHAYGRLEELLRRPQLGYAALTPVDVERPELEPLVMEQIEVELKYEGYIRREQREIDEMRRLENRLLPPDAPYAAIHGLRKEAQEKLARVRPRSIPYQRGQPGGCVCADRMERCADPGRLRGVQMNGCARRLPLYRKKGTETA